MFNLLQIEQSNCSATIRPDRCDWLPVIGVDSVEELARAGGVNVCFASTVARVSIDPLLLSLVDYGAPKHIPMSNPMPGPSRTRVHAHLANRSINRADQSGTRSPRDAQVAFDYLPRLSWPPTVAGVDESPPTSHTRMSLLVGGV